MQKNVKTLVYCAVCIALSVATGSLTLFSLPNGGSVTPGSMLFACLPGFFFGPAYGVASGVAYGLLSFILKPYFYTPLQVLVDYPLAFGALGVSGFFYKRPNGLHIGYVLSCIARFFFAFLSGVLFFASYAPEGMSPILYSAGYNISYIGAEALLTLLLISVPAVKKAIYRIKGSCL